VLDSSVAITADRVAAVAGNNCLMRLLIDMLDSGILLVPGAVAHEICGKSGENCNSGTCRDFCSATRNDPKQGEPRPAASTRQALWLSLAYGLDRGEAEALAAALYAARQGLAEKVVVLSSDAAARRAAKRLHHSPGIEVHGDLYLIELAKKLGYCTALEAAEIAESLPRLRRYVSRGVAATAAERLRRQNPSI